LVAAVLFLALSASIVLSSPHNITIEGWISTTPLPQALANRNAIVRGEYIFFVGGKSAADAPVSTIYAAPIENSGTLTAWTAVGQLPIPLYLHAIVATESNLYVIGGWDGTRTHAEVWQAPFTGGSGLGSFVQVSTYPISIDLHDAVIAQNRIYVIGGWTGRDPLNTVYSAEILPGGLGPWLATATLPRALYRLSAVAYNNRIYVTGGFDNTSAQSTVYVTNVLADGTLDGWHETTSLPVALFFHETVVQDGRLVVLGGRNSIAEFAGVYAATIDSNGLLSAWTPQLQLPETLHRFAAVSVARNGSDFVYVIGGLHGADYRATVYRSTYPEPPTPTATPTATPTPQPEALVDIVLQNQPQQWIAPGEEVTYTITYRNRGTAILDDVAIANVVPDSVELLPDTIQASGSGIYTFTGTTAGATIRWSVGAVPPDGSGQVRFRVRRPLPTPPAIPRVIAVDVSGPSTAIAGAPINYTVWLTNNTAFPVTGLTLAVTLPAGANYLSGGSAAPEQSQLAWTIPELLGDETVTRKFAVSAAQSLVLYQYYAVSDEGPTVRGHHVLVTTIEGTDPLPPGDGTLITNSGASLLWQVENQPMASHSNSVHNPAYQLHLPLVAR
jgi:uncharacterized repeat protein (TIGR01451 family)